ncbi:MAG TPA: PH domain-containing protein [Syntrophomonadaceae bacterium]|nr:PH domain-containing protein [Syntrophomonadaceae bacterium]
MKIKVMPSKAFWLGLILGGMIFGFIFWGINYSLGSGDEALKMALILPAYLFAGIFIVLLIGSFNLRYQIEDDHLLIYWGIRTIKVPFTEINEIIQVKGRANLFSILGVSWPGYMVGLYSAKGLGPVRMYATQPYQGFVYLKTNLGFFGLTPADDTLIKTVAQRTEKEITIADMDKIPEETKGKSMQEDRFYRLLFTLNIVFLLAFAVYLALFFPGSGAPSFVVLLLVLAIALFFFNISNAGRLYQFSEMGGYILLIIGLAVTGIFLILALSEISL